eukprot:15357692-Ditylum_brightwellii.AAC.1
MDAFRASFNAKQKENESLQDYTRMFKTSKDILESHLGDPILLEKFVATMDGYDAKNEDSVVLYSRKVSEQLFAYIYLENSDQLKYGTILKGLNKQKSLGNDQYLKSITETNNVLSNHHFDNKEHCQGKNRRSDGTESTPTEDTDEPPTLSFTQMVG